jgi:hypothetical protein
MICRVIWQAMHLPHHQKNKNNNEPGKRRSTGNRAVGRANVTARESLQEENKSGQAVICVYLGE